MTFKQILNRINKTLPFVSFVIGADSAYISRTERNARLNQETNDIRRLSTEVNRLSSELNSNKDIIITQQENQTKIEELTNHVIQQYSSMSENDKIINDINNKLNDVNITSDNKESLIKELIKHYETLSKSFKTTKNDLNEINEIINSYKPKESNIFGTFNDLIINIREYYLSLELEQIIALTHLSGIIFIISCLFSILIITYSDYLVKYFNLEDKFPKLHKYLLLRSKINKYSLLSNIIMIVIMFLMIIIFDLYLFFLIK